MLPAAFGCPANGATAQPTDRGLKLGHAHLEPGMGVSDGEAARIVAPGLMVFSRNPTDAALHELKHIYDEARKTGDSGTCR